jgi:hypothetical protein
VRKLQPGNRRERARPCRSHIGAAMDEKTIRTRALNDALRATLQGGKVIMTASVNALPAAIQATALAAMRTFSDFTEDNDPHGEHDFGSFEIEGEKFFFKIDYFDKDMEYGSEDPSSPAKTTRVLTLMLAKDY